MCAAATVERIIFYVNAPPALKAQGFMVDDIRTELALYTYYNIMYLDIQYFSLLTIEQKHIFL